MSVVIYGLFGDSETHPFFKQQICIPQQVYPYGTYKLYFLLNFMSTNNVKKVYDHSENRHHKRRVIKMQLKVTHDLILY